jgi:hypothetical protein
VLCFGLLKSSVHDDVVFGNADEGIRADCPCMVLVLQGVYNNLRIDARDWIFHSETSRSIEH